MTAPLAGAVEGGLAPLEAVRRCEGVFLFALVWSIGASAATVKGRTQFDTFLRAAVAGKLPCALCPLSVLLRITAVVLGRLPLPLGCSFS